MNMDEYSTKEIILFKSIKLISDNSFESVSIRDIATEVGIKSSSIYNHYSSKEDILTSIYDYFKLHVYDALKSSDYMKEYVKVCTPAQFVNDLRLTFDNGSAQQYLNMTLIIKIIYNRIFIDEDAKDIFMNLLGADMINYSKNILDYGISIGRIKPIDTQLFATFFNVNLHMMGIKAFTNPEHTTQSLQEEIFIKQYFTDMLSFT